MKKFILSILVLMVAFLFLGCKENAKDNTYEIAMVTDYGDITDQSFNQTTYETAKKYAEDNNKSFAYYKPVNDSTDARVEKIEEAISKGAKVVVMPGFAFAGAIVAVQDQHKDVKFIALDVSEYDIEDQFYNHDANGARTTLKDENNKPHVSSNVTSIVFQEEESGYLAGYAAVKEGETKLGFLGGMAVPAVQRFGYGYIQGIAAAAKEMNVKVDLWYVYGGQFSGDATITTAMETWVKNGCQTVFACGGGIYTSIIDAGKGGKCKLIGVDTDQSKVVKDIEVLTSAMKGLADATKSCLDDFYGEWKNGGKVLTWGLKTDATKEYVGLPRETWTMKNFTTANYDSVIKDIRDGKITISSDTTKDPKDFLNENVTAKNDNFGASIK